jgi:phage shock protein A
MSILSRLFKIGQAEAHAITDKLEDPIKLTEQGIRDMKADLDQSLKGLAEVKAMMIRSKTDAKKFDDAAVNYEQKAMAILKKVQTGDVSAEDADRLAGEALRKKEENEASAKRTKAELQTFESSSSKLEVNVKKIKSNISQWENELKTLKARIKVSDTTLKLNKQLSQTDSSSTIAMLEKMKEKVDQDEALSEAYEDISNETKSVDEEIDSVLKEDTSSTSLDELKKKMGI